MEGVLSNLKIQINPKLYVKDPETSILGKKIVQQSIQMIVSIGFEEFTFKKLGEKIGSNESSIYRYFENKHKLLIYLSSWYWSWMEYRMVFGTANIADPYEQLTIAIQIVTEKISDDMATEHIDEAALNSIIVSEFTKTFHTKEVDADNKEGFFIIYKRVISRMTKMILAVNPNYAYPKSLSSNIIEGALHQHYIKDHFKTITDCNEVVSPSQFYIDLALNVLKT